MKKLIILICILFSFQIPLSAVTFPSNIIQNYATRKPNQLKVPVSLEYTLKTALLVGGYFLWLIATNSDKLRWYAYPYARQDDKSLLYGNYIVNGEKISASYFNKGRASLDTAAVYLNGFGIGNETRFDCMACFFGPYFENLVLYKYDDVDDFIEKGLRDNFKLGLQFGIIQTDLLNAIFLVQYSGWQGKNLGNFEHGCNFGGIFRSYPVKPLVLEWKFGWQVYRHGYRVFESNLQVGLLRILHKKIEIFAGWKVLAFKNFSDDIHFGTYHGISTGIRIY